MNRETKLDIIELSRAYFGVAIMTLAGFCKIYEINLLNFFMLVGIK